MAGCPPARSEEQGGSTAHTASLRLSYRSAKTKRPTEDFSGGKGADFSAGRGGGGIAGSGAGFDGPGEEREGGGSGNWCGGFLFSLVFALLAPE